MFVGYVQCVVWSVQCWQGRHNVHTTVYCTGIDDLSIINLSVHCSATLGMCDLFKTKYPQSLWYTKNV